MFFPELIVLSRGIHQTGGFNRPVLQVPYLGDAADNRHEQQTGRGSNEHALLPPLFLNFLPLLRRQVIFDLLTKRAYFRKRIARLNPVVVIPQRKQRALRQVAPARMAILQCYRHLFYPSSSRMTGTGLDLGYMMIELSGPGDSPGNGQHQVERVLHDHKKLLDGGDIPDSPPFVRDQTGLRVKGEMTTAQIRTEYRRAPKLSILLHDTPLFECIRNGIDQGLFIYREGSQVWGPGDMRPVIHISDNHFVHTIDNAKAKGLWPRAAPLELHFQANPTTIERGGSSEL